jgi:hypothetical protein
MSSASSLTSISSRASVEIYNETLKEEIISIEQSQIDLSELVDAAEKVISEKFTPSLQRVYTYKKESEKTSIDLDDVMKAMLACAGESRGQRYVASAIVACNQKEDVVEMLVALGTTWLTHFLFVCQFRGLAIHRKNLMFSLVQTSRSHQSQPNQEPSELATPTLQETVSHMGEGVGHRTDSFKDDVRRRMILIFLP